MFTCKLFEGSNVLYSELTFNTHNLFGCVSIIKKDNCIFNKQYSKDEFEILKAKIVAHMRETGEYGEFFPGTISPFTYNESVAQEYFRLTKEQAIQRGYRWYDRPTRNYQIGGDILGCPNAKSSGHPECTTAFRITPQEKAFYDKMNLPTPEFCFPCRRVARLAMRNPRQLWHRKCMNTGCDNEFETSYAPDPRSAGGFGEARRSEIVFCESCYNQIVA